VIWCRIYCRYIPKSSPFFVSVAPSTSDAVDNLAADLGAALPTADDPRASFSTNMMGRRVIDDLPVHKDPIGLLRSDYEVEVRR